MPAQAIIVNRALPNHPQINQQGHANPAENNAHTQAEKK
jgi:hypothetical protein